MLKARRLLSGIAALAWAMQAAAGCGNDSDAEPPSAQGGAGHGGNAEGGANAGGSPVVGGASDGGAADDGAAGGGAPGSDGGAYFSEGGVKPGLGEDADHCLHLVAMPSEALIGQDVSLNWDPESPDVELLPILNDDRARLVSDGKGGWKLHCNAAGTIEVKALVNATCQETRDPIFVTCLAPDEPTCCPFTLPENGCADFGGSPPCYRGCECFSSSGQLNVTGGEEYLGKDENGCWTRRLSWLDDGETIECRTATGNLEADARALPRAASGCSLGELPAEISSELCDGLREELEGLPPAELGPGDADPPCNSAGRWRIEFPEGTCAPASVANYFTLPPLVDLELESPEQLIPSEDGCQLSFAADRPWDFGECGADGYRLDLRVSGDEAEGVLRAVETGYLTGQAISIARAKRVQ